MFRMTEKLSAMPVFFATLLVSDPVFAYLDPGTGSILLQGIIAALAAIGVTARLYWHRVLQLFGRRNPEEQESGAGEEQDKSPGGTGDYD